MWLCLWSSIHHCAFSGVTVIWYQFDPPPLVSMISLLPQKMFDEIAWWQCHITPLKHFNCPEAWKNWKIRRILCFFAFISDVDNDFEEKCDWAVVVYFLLVTLYRKNFAQVFEIRWFIGRGRHTGSCLTPDSSTTWIGNKDKHYQRIESASFLAV